MILPRITCAALAAFLACGPAAADDADAALAALVGKSEGAVEQRLGPPDERESNGVQTFLRYRAFDFRRTTAKPYPFGYSQGYSGPLGYRDSASFNCMTTLVFSEGVLRAYARRGIGCR